MSHVVSSNRTRASTVKTRERSSVTEEGFKTVALSHGLQNVSAHKTRHYLKIQVKHELVSSANEQF